MDADKEDIEAAREFSDYLMEKYPGFQQKTIPKGYRVSRVEKIGSYIFEILEKISK